MPTERFRDMAVCKQICRWKWGNNPTNDEYNGQRIILRAQSHYCSTAAWVEHLVSIALKDFPQLQKDDIEVVKYGGDRIKGFMGIEFDPVDWKIPASYEETKEMQPTY